VRDFELHISVKDSYAPHEEYIGYLLFVFPHKTSVWFKTPRNQTSTITRLEFYSYWDVDCEKLYP
jgi:hypothetical protein